MKNINGMKKQMVAVFSILCVFGLAGCEKEAKETTTQFDLPTELSDCKIFNLKSDQGAAMTVVRCPLSTTTTLTSAKGATPVVVTENIQEQPHIVMYNNGFAKINGEVYKKYEEVNHLAVNDEASRVLSFS